MNLFNLKDEEFNKEVDKFLNNYSPDFLLEELMGGKNYEKDK